MNLFQCLEVKMQEMFLGLKQFMTIIIIEI
ncbi:MAG TPA: hypothetical protein [Caudoviricetes sp.]|nr:MAG TPA: hypothetical protein [Caudoviricetes sp.]